MEGDRTMLVWLGKQLLGQKEKKETDLTVQGGEIPIKTQEILPVKQRIKIYEKIFHDSTST
jgi:hypothetical protein